MSNASTADAPKTATWRDVFTNLRQPKVLVMLLLGFSSGIPLYLVGNTLGMWMREGGIELSTIGFMSWVGLAYSLKFVWAPLIDKTRVPILGRLLGRRRGWMVASQIVAAAGLLGMAMIQPTTGEATLLGFRLDHLVVFGGCALIAAFASATQDIVIDAWRIDNSDSKEEMSLLNSSSAIGYRGALLLTDAWILVFAAHFGWSLSYTIMAALLGVGTIAAIIAKEGNSEPRPRIPTSELLGISNATAVKWIFGLVLALVWAVFFGIWMSNPDTFTWPRAIAMIAALFAIWALVRKPKQTGEEATWARPMVLPLINARSAILDPLVEFVRKNGKWAVMMLIAISLYRLPDFVMGPMNNPFYADIGISKDTVGEIRGTIGLIATVVGVAFAGVSAVRLGFSTTLIIGAILGPGSNLAFAYLAMHGNDIQVFSMAMIIDNFCSGFAGVALVGYMSSLTSPGYTATQYALLSSLYALLGKILKGFSGVAVETLQQGRSMEEGYALFFVGTALVGIPAVICCFILMFRKEPDEVISNHAA